MGSSMEYEELSGFGRLGTAKPQMPQNPKTPKPQVSFFDGFSKLRGLNSNLRKFDLFKNWRWWSAEIRIRRTKTTGKWTCSPAIDKAWKFARPHRKKSYLVAFASSLRYFSTCRKRTKKIKRWISSGPKNHTAPRAWAERAVICWVGQARRKAVRAC